MRRLNRGKLIHDIESEIGYYSRLRQYSDKNLIKYWNYYYKNIKRK
jgi:hypothetical protein